MAVPTGLKNLSSLNNFADFSGYLAGETPLASTPGGTYGEDASYQSSREPTSGNAAPDSTAQTQVPNSTLLFNPSAGNSSAGLFNPIQKGLSASSEQLQNLGKTFRESAGASRSFEGIGASGTLERALGANAGAEDIQRAKDLAGASYQGPTGLNAESTATLQNQLGQARDYAKSLTGGEGVTAALSAGGGLTPGEARYEAGQLMGSQGFQQQARETSKQAQGAYDAMLKEIADAEAYATQRTNEERAISTQAKDYLTGRKADTLANVDETVAKAQSQDARTQELYDAFQQTGDMLTLQDVAPDAARGFMQTLPNQRRQEAEALLESIMAKYPDISNVPLGSLTVTPTGMETLTKPGEDLGGKAWYVQDPYDFTGGDNLMDLAKSLMAQKQARAGQADDFQQYVKRQYELGKAFSPGSAAAAEGYVKTGEYADVMPYKGGGEFGGYERPDVRRFVEMDLGVPANRENMSTEDQRRVVNRVGEILGEADRLEAAGEPYRAAAVVANLDSFIEEENANLESASKDAKKSAWKWVNTVKEVRRQYKKAKEKARWGKLVGGIGAGLSVLTFGTTAPLMAGLGASESTAPIWARQKQ